MNRRLQQFLSAENITQAQFADEIDVARASVSHILSGRNKPGFDFIEKTAAHFPNLNLDWLICGKGKMYKQGYDEIFSPDESEEIAETQFVTEAPSDIDVPVGAVESAPVTQPAPEAERPSLTESRSKARIEIVGDKSLSTNKSISKVIVFFSDNTFQELH